MKKERPYPPIPASIGDWIHKETAGRENALTPKEIATRVRIFRKQMGKDKPVTADQLGSILCQARKHMELTHGVTLWNVRGIGWRSASPKETAYYGMSSTKKLLVLGDRVRRLSDIVDRKYIPEAFEKVFGSTDEGVRSLLGRGKGFLLMWAKKQEESATTLLEDMTKKKGTNGQI